ncbi:MAG: MaoC family dehydratase [Clostridiales bacterium]|nr:MaoC family dehydratase [Clostridiales bacterium]
MSNFNPDNFLILYPGIWSEREKAAAEAYLAENRAIGERGTVDVEALINGTLPAGTPGIGPKIEVTEAMVRYNSEKYDPENPVLNDAEYAKLLGYKDIIAMPCFGAHDDSYMAPFPPAVRDTLLVSQLNHSVTAYKPIYPGDTLYLVYNSRHVTDYTPQEGSIYRSIVIRSTGSVYNQRGEKVNDVIFRVMESIKVYKDVSMRPEKPGFMDIWEAPDWMSRKAHYYTDKDWEYIKAVWSAEKRRGSEKLYWEDVKIGDEPQITADGPIIESLAPTAPYGMGVGGSRTMKKEMLDPEIFKTMIRDEQTGMYMLPDKKAYVPEVPDNAKPVWALDPGKGDDAAIDTKDIHKQSEVRGALINFLGRDIAIRHINNWMGDYGWLTEIRWGIMPAEGHWALGKQVPKNPEVVEFLDKVPYMKGRQVMAHGLTGDLALVKSYVYDKYACDGEFFAELAWWIETIEGDIWLAGGATVKLPSRRK